MIPTLIGISLITFIVIHLAPGDPTTMKLTVAQQGIKSEVVSKQIIEETRKLYGLDKPLHVQYWIWLKQLATLNFGNSYKDHQPVIKKIAEKLPITLALNIISIFLAYVIAIPLGVSSALKRDTIGDRTTTFFLFALYSLPSFWVATLLIRYLGGGEFLNLFPIVGIISDQTAGWTFLQKLGNVLWHMVLPVTCLTYASFAYLSRLMRAEMLEVLRQDYIRTAKAKGLSNRLVIFKHALRNSLIPIITIMAMLLPALIGGSVIIESIFTIPGMGNLGFEAILTKDYPVIMAVTAISAFLTLIGLLLSDVLYVMIDPRITFEETL
jgi:peptide/nickel transport system permease protein